MQTKQTLLALLLCALFLSGNAQVADNFTDGNFTVNPTWMGDDSLFRVFSGELKLNGSIASDAHLVTDHNLLDSICWTFLCRFELSPSTQNFARFYLASDQDNLEGALNGYYVQLGGSTGNTDSIALYRQNGIVRTRIIAGRPATVARSNNKVRVKVFRDMQGNWELYSDTSGGTAYILEGTGIDRSITSSNYLGWFIKYTAGNNQKYFLDDVRAYKPVADTLAPLVDSIVVHSANSMMVYFNESLQEAAARNPVNYTVTPPGINPVSATLNGSQVMLQFRESYTSGTFYTLNILNIKDEAGNTIKPYLFSFRYYQPELHDLLISEFMPDPSPAAGLPEQEFIELYNHTAHDISLSGFSVSDGTTTATLPAVIIAPDSFVIVCPQTAAPVMAPYGKLAIVSSLPSLNNTSDHLSLKHESGTVIHELAYDLSWYRDASRDDGGYSIELNYPEQLCKGKLCYSASSNVSGGTPGKVNSLWDPQRDTTGPDIASIQTISSSQLLVVFNEQIKGSSINHADINLQPAIAVSSLQMRSADSLYINLSSHLAGRTSYVLRINKATDCSGNTANVKAAFDYYIPDTAVNYDVLIHEIMANPEPAQQLPDAEYIELYNRSNKVISLKGWTIGDAGTIATLPGFILLPDSFIVITSVFNSTLFDVKTIGVSNFPSLGNDGDQPVLKNATGQVIHSVQYTSGWYADGFKKQGGFSLEMMDAENPCGPGNWMATNNPAGGTPGKSNSITASNKDRDAPYLLSAYPLDSSRVELFFSEAMDSVSLRASRFLLNNNFSPVSITGRASDYQSTILQFADTLVFGTVYTIMADSLADCAHNLIENERTVAFERPWPADSGSLVINEVLFNSRTNAFDFVELYNRSDKPLDVKNLMLAKRNANAGLDEIHALAPNGFVIRPTAHAVFTPDPVSLQQQYYCKFPSLIVATQLPALSDESGHVILVDRTGKIYDELAYDDDMHFALLDDKNGVSLERIDYNRATNVRSNWTSASAASGYATPTCRNSQYVQTSHSDHTLVIQPKRISPDGDGYEDVMNINYSLNATGYTGNLWIYDANGTMIRQLMKNEVMGSNGTYTWDGTTTSGNKASIGIYIFRLEVFNLNGDVKEYRAVGVVAGKL